MSSNGHSPHGGARTSLAWAAQPGESTLIVRSVLGLGDFGTTYLVEGGRREPERVLKLPRASVKRPRMVDAHKQQAKALRTLQRRGRVVAPEAVEVEGRLALVRPWIEGRSLEQLLAPGAVPGRAAAELIGRIANLLHLGTNAYDRRRNRLGLVHSALHSGNIIIGYGGKVDLVDWGVSASWIHTRLDEVQPPLSPMAPERVQGGQPSPASDMWELGVLVDAMLATSSAGGPELAELSSRLLAEDPEARPEAREVARICSAVVTERSGPRLFDWVQDRWDATVPKTPSRLAEFPPGSELLCLLPQEPAPVMARAQVRVRPLRPGEGPEPLPQAEPQADFFSEEEDDWDPDDEITEEFGAPPPLEGLVPTMMVPSPSLSARPSTLPPQQPEPTPEPQAPAVAGLTPLMWAVLVVGALVIGVGMALGVGLLLSWV